ncbi:MAG: ABC transporter permease [Spirochaetota bacterium]|nr:ABC transporter permease [Spirochaetota bacterium]
MKVDKKIFPWKNNIITFYLSTILIITLASFFAKEISGHSPFQIKFSGALPPSQKHLFGTDFLGRDILSRTLIAGRISIAVGLAARLGSVILGLIIGILSGLSSRGIRSMLNGIIEVFLSIPSLLLALALSVSLGEGFRTIIIAIVVGTWAPVAKFVLVRVTQIKNEDYVVSARAIGSDNIRIIIFSIIPALIPSLLPIITTGIATSIMMESTLSFLGMGGASSIDTIPSWGLMIQEGSRFIFEAPWLILPPSLILMILILCFNQIGDKLSSKS